MAKIEWSAGIDSVSGALSKPGNNPQHRCSKMLIGTHRVAPTESQDCNRIYLRKKTFNAYLWKVCGQAYDAEHPRS